MTGGASKEDLAHGVRNLLRNCAELTSGARVAVIHEDPALGWYDLEAPLAVAEGIRELGGTVTLLQVGAPGNEPNPAALEAVAAHDTTIFFARIGDQDRFESSPPDKTLVMCYARKAEALASSFGGTGHRALLALKEAVNETLFGAEEVRITCPLGSDVRGRVSPAERDPASDAGVRRFPVGVHQPLSAKGFSGQVALARYLTPTGSKVYEPASLAIGSPVMADISAGRWHSLSGDPKTVEEIQAHYRNVAAAFEIDPQAIDSWHAGIHPGCAYGVSAAEDPDRWSNTVFNNPRFLHFHTCGGYPPGEICWMLLDSSVAVEGEKLWDRGRLRPEAFPATRACLKDWPELAGLFETPSDSIGL